tara:strand:+ start:192 stop:611 length:420 start_codon:yes stop_codon:yes gene_type:complete
MDKVKYSKEIKQMRKVLNDHEYTRTLSPGYHQFLSDMHRKMVSASKISPKMENHINQAFNYYKNHNKPEVKANREKMLSKVTKLKSMLLQCGYTQQYEQERMDFLDGLTDRIYIKGTLTPKQAKWANSMYKQFNKKILP